MQASRGFKRFSTLLHHEFQSEQKVRAIKMAQNGFSGDIVKVLNKAVVYIAPSSSSVNGELFEDNADCADVGCDHTKKVMICFVFLHV